jgi:hypothetical protein
MKFYRTRTAIRIVQNREHHNRSKFEHAIFDAFTSCRLPQVMHSMKVSSIMNLDGIFSFAKPIASKTVSHLSVKTHRELSS